MAYLRWGGAGILWPAVLSDGDDDWRRINTDERPTDGRVAQRQALAEDDTERRAVLVSGTDVWHFRHLCLPERGNTRERKRSAADAAV